ncbi:hypothetical protein TrVE_jg5553 [Triparma verrucosa]|uniref:Mitochondrial carrier n=2 Tax=Triparma TaxID=722752 RepID=A0A9W7EQQ7_9STRA|nr:hypothetical protein TrST_g6881 [Triparma strigata]GMH91624.1 hypothetical protein TrVE_jg5553 [Triparma verrucosa]
MADENPTTIREVTKDVFSAFVGSVFNAYVGQPFDTFKVRQQTAGLSIPHTLKNILSESPAAFWKGVVPTTAGMMFENAMAFGINAHLKRTFPSTLPPVDIGHGGRSTLSFSEDILRPMSMGFLTGFASSFVLVSSEIIKTQTQISTKKVSSLEITKYIINKRGVKGLFIGMDAQIMRDGPFYAVFFGSYEIFKYAIHHLSPSLPEDVNFFLSGGFAGMVGWAVAMPFDVPKTLVQSNPEGKVFGEYFPKMREVVKTRGVANGLYAGLVPTLLRAFPSNAALFLGVEWAKKFFDENVPK